MFLFKHLQIIVELLSVQLLQGLHVLKAFLKVLNLSLHRYLQLSIALGSINPQLLDLLSEVLLALIALSHVFLFLLHMLVEFVFYFFGVVVHEVLALLGKLILDLLQLLEVALTDIEELLPHVYNHSFNIRRVFFEHLHIIVIFLLQLIPKLLY